MSDQRFIIEMGMGNDQYGKDYTKAATRAIEDAIRHSAIECEAGRRRGLRRVHHVDAVHHPHHGNLARPREKRLELGIGGGIGKGHAGEHRTAQRKEKAPRPEAVGASHGTRDSSIPRRFRLRGTGI